MREWRWDQGRVLYFQTDVLKEIAKVLMDFDGKDINEPAVNRAFAVSLRTRVGLPFAAPEEYKINRNYGRVFQCGLLARYQGSALTVSDIGKLMATENSVMADSDAYLCEVVRRFRYPFPAFQDYDADLPRIYPFCAVIKYLIALACMGQEAKASLADICNMVVGNECMGNESIEFYQQLQPSGYMAQGDVLRQLREMIAFISQLSFLKIFDGCLYLDVNTEEEARRIFQSVTKPLTCIPLVNKLEEFSQLTKVESGLVMPITGFGSKGESQIDVSIDEGQRIKLQHFRIERSPLLRKFYIAAHPEPVCTACEEHMQHKYPWSGYMLDVHHLLPLASAIKEGTTLSDLVGLCPSCHRAIHAYYRKWLKANHQSDFVSKQEAMSVYLEAVREIAI